jgi:hypothetical protein
MGQKELLEGPGDDQMIVRMVNGHLFQQQRLEKMKGVFEFVSPQPTLQEHLADYIPVHIVHQRGLEVSPKETKGKGRESSSNMDHIVAPQSWKQA